MSRVHDDERLAGVYQGAPRKPCPTRSDLFDLFDLAVLSRVIHHLPDRVRVARALARILQPSGVTVIRTTFR
ncbi:methyltransferase domain-containing protein [Streptomyces decoyicus]